MEAGSPWTILISILSAVVVAYVSYLLGLSRDKRLRRDELDRHAQYLAIRVVCKLDPFVSECCEVVDDKGADDQNGETVPLVAAPSLSFPEDVDWKSVPPDLMYRILGFPNEIENADLNIASVVEYADGPPDHSEFFDARTIQYAQLGLIALALADDLREKYKIPKQNFGNHNPKKVLEKALQQASADRDAAQARSDEFMEELSAKYGKPEPPTTPKEP